MIVDINFEDSRWQDFGLQELAAAAADMTFEHLGMAGTEWEVSVLACDDARIAVLNSDFRAKSAATNVLSWPSEERGAAVAGTSPDAPDAQDPELGDIAIAYETCAREAAETGKTMQSHVTHLMVHGILHLLGYDHIRDQDATLMERLEIEILGKMGLPDPYRHIQG